MRFIFLFFLILFSFNCFSEGNYFQYQDEALAPKSYLSSFISPVFYAKQTSSVQGNFNENPKMTTFELSEIKISKFRRSFKLERDSDDEIILEKINEKAEQIISEFKALKLSDYNKEFINAAADVILQLFQYEHSNINTDLIIKENAQKLLIDFLSDYSYPGWVKKVFFRKIGDLYLNSIHYAPSMSNHLINALLSVPNFLNLANLVKDDTSALREYFHVINSIVNNYIKFIGEGSFAARPEKLKDNALSLIAKLKELSMDNNIPEARNLAFESFTYIFSYVDLSLNKLDEKSGVDVRKNYNDFKKIVIENLLNDLSGSLSDLHSDKAKVADILDMSNKLSTDSIRDHVKFFLFHSRTASAYHYLLIYKFRNDKAFLQSLAADNRFSLKIRLYSSGLLAEFHDYLNENIISEIPEFLENIEKYIDMNELTTSPFSDQEIKVLNFAVLMWKNFSLLKDKELYRSDELKKALINTMKSKLSLGDNADSSLNYGNWLLKANAGQKQTLMIIIHELQHRYLNEVQNLKTVSSLDIFSIHEFMCDLAAYSMDENLWKGIGKENFERIVNSRGNLFNVINKGYLSNNPHEIARSQLLLIEEALKEDNNYSWNDFYASALYVLSSKNSPRYNFREFILRTMEIYQRMRKGENPIDLVALHEVDKGNSNPSVVNVVNKNELRMIIDKNSKSFVNVEKSPDILKILYVFGSQNLSELKETIDLILNDYNYDSEFKIKLIEFKRSLDYRSLKLLPIYKSVNPKDIAKVILQDKLTEFYLLLLFFPENIELANINSWLHQVEGIEGLDKGYVKDASVSIKLASVRAMSVAS